MANAITIVSGNLYLTDKEILEEKSTRVVDLLSAKLEKDTTLAQYTSDITAQMEKAITIAEQYKGEDYSDWRDKKFCLHLRICAEMILIMRLPFLTIRFSLQKIEQRHIRFSHISFLKTAVFLGREKFKYYLKLFIRPIFRSRSIRYASRTHRKSGKKNRV